MAESPGGLLCDQFSTRCSPSPSASHDHHHHRPANSHLQGAHPGEGRLGSGGSGGFGGGAGSGGAAGGGAGPPPDPTYDPLARWFLTHYSQLQAAGRLWVGPKAVLA